MTFTAKKLCNLLRCFLASTTMMKGESAMNTSKIVNIGNSGTVGVGEVEGEVEEAGIVTVCVLLQSLVLPMN